jgi:hypothetical protein
MVTRSTKNVSRISLSVSPKKQNLETVNKIVALVLNRAGCDNCGRLAYFDFRFLGDPDPDFERLGGISVDITQR